jgi:membrane fusion protein
MSERQLFRPEAIEAQRTPYLGRVQLVRPLALGLVTAAVVVMTAAIGVFLFSTDYTRKTTIVGTLVPDRGLIRLVPPEAGTVLERHVDEGKQVAAGQVLFVLALERPRLLDEAQAQVRRSLQDRQRLLQESAARQQGLAAAQLATLDRRLQALAGELAQLDVEAGLLQQRQALAQQALTRLEALRDEQFISAAQVQAKAEELLGLRAQAQALQRQRTTLQRERAQLEGERRGVPLLAQGAQSGIERELAALDQETAEQQAERRVIVRAPQAGVVSALLADVGQSVGTSAALASLVPAGATLQAHLYAPSSAVGFVRPGQEVRLRYEAYPYQKFGHQAGRVSQVSRTPLGPGEMAALSLAAPPGRGAEPLFRITVALEQDGRTAWPQPLVAGMRLAADVRLETRRLVEWLFEPLISLGGRW